MMEMSGEIDLRISGFEMGEIDVAFEASGSDEEDDLPALNETSTPVAKPGDLWLLGPILTSRAGRNHDACRHYRIDFSRNGFFDER